MTLQENMSELMKYDAKQTYVKEYISKQPQKTHPTQSRTAAYVGAESLHPCLNSWIQTKVVHRSRHCPRRILGKERGSTLVAFLSSPAYYVYVNILRGHSTRQLTLCTSIWPLSGSNLRFMMATTRIKELKDD